MDERASLDRINQIYSILVGELAKIYPLRGQFIIDKDFWIFREYYQKAPKGKVCVDMESKFSKLIWYFSRLGEYVDHITNDPRGRHGKLRFEMHIDLARPADEKFTKYCDQDASRFDHVPKKIRDNWDKLYGVFSAIPGFREMDYNFLYLSIVFD